MKRAGITMLELLVVIFILSILAGMIVSTYGASTIKAKGTVDISNLHQIGTAMEIYRQQSESGSYSVPNLVASQLTSHQIWKSPLDVIDEGYANWLVRENIALHDPNHPYLTLSNPVSYIGADAYNVTPESCDFTRQDTGWLIRTHKLDKQSPGPAPGKPVLLLSGDTSVKRFVPPFQKKDDGFELTLSDVFCPHQK